MLAQLRQARILEEIHRTGGVRVSNLTDILGVSDMTIRRDLDAMARKGLVSKVHGGATAVDTAPEFTGQACSVEDPECEACQ